MHRSTTLVLGLVLLGAAPARAQLVRSAAGAGPTDAALLAARDAFRSDLGGGTTAGANGSFGGLRREINWDGVPAGSSAPNNFPANFFNSTSPRGAVFSTPGTGFQVSATAADPAGANFANLNATYTNTFQPFSPQRLFTALGSNVTDVNFFLPGTTTPATVSGFGAIFGDVDLANTTTLQFFDAARNSLGAFNVPALAGSQTLSFLGVSFPTPVIGSVRITSGNIAPGANDGGANDVVVMDDFLYSEPVPEPGSFVVCAFAAGLAMGRRRRPRA